MIDKQEYYHGAAIIRLLEDERCRTIKKYDFGYLVNDAIFIFLKYSTKNRSPWQFNFKDDEMVRLKSIKDQGRKIVIVLICGGDGICALIDSEFETVLKYKAGCISSRRNFKKQYGVKGSVGNLERKISFKRWPAIIFDALSEIENKGGNCG